MSDTVCLCLLSVSQTQSVGWAWALASHVELGRVVPCRPFVSAVAFRWSLNVRLNVRVSVDIYV